MAVVPRFDVALSGRQSVHALLSSLGLRRDARAAERIHAFEEAFARWLDFFAPASGPGSGTAVEASAPMHCTFVTSARGGLFLLLDALRARLPATRPFVIVPAWTHASVPAVVRAAGFIPWYADCDPHTLNADADSVPADVWPQACAAIVTHLYGTPADMDGWKRYASAHSVVLLEDCAQALGARLSDGTRCGTQGRAAIFSFSLTKNLTTLGGGMVATRDEGLAAALRQRVGGDPSVCGKPPSVCGSGVAALRKQAVLAFAFHVATRPTVFGLAVRPALLLGWRLLGRDILHDAFEEPLRFVPPAATLAPPHPLQAALGLSQLHGLDAANARRTEMGQRLHALLQGTHGVVLPAWPAASRPIFMSFVLRVRRRLAFLRELLRRGVDASPGYLRACHRIPTLLDSTAPRAQVECPHALALEAEQVHLPVYPRLTAREVEQVARAAHAAAEVVWVDLDGRPLQDRPLVAPRGWSA